MWLDAAYFHIVSCKNQPTMAKGASRDMLVYLSIRWRGDTGVPRDCLPAAMDDMVGWRKRAMGWGGGGGGGGGGGRLKSA